MFDDAAKVEVSKRNRVIYVPIEIEPTPDQFSPDGFHPSASSYKELGRQVAAAIWSRLERQWLKSHWHRHTSTPHLNSLSPRQQTITDRVEGLVNEKLPVMKP